MTNKTLAILKNQTGILFCLVIILLASVTYLAIDKYYSSQFIKKLSEKNESDFYNQNKMIDKLTEYLDNYSLGNIYDDLIILPPQNIDEDFGIKAYREYTVAFRITEVDSNEELYEGKLEKIIELNNVLDATICVFYINSENMYFIPKFDYNEMYIRKNFKSFKPNQFLNNKGNNGWQFLYCQNIMLDTAKTFSSARENRTGLKTIPIYSYNLRNSVGPDYDFNAFRHTIHFTNFDSLFYYDHDKTLVYNGQNLKKRIFKLIFQPQYKIGWYKIRIFSKNNALLSIYSENKNLFYYAYNNYLSQLYGKIKKYNVPDYLHYNFKPHDYEDFKLFIKKINEAIANAIINKNKNDVDYLETYKKIVFFIHPRKNKFINSCHGYIDYNIFLDIPGIKNVM